MSSSHPPSQVTPITAAVAALRDAGWPDVNGLDLDAITDALVLSGVSPDDAAAAVPAALAQLYAESVRSSTYVDVDRCTAHLLVLRQRDQVRYFSIDYVLTVLTAVHGSPFLPHDNKNLH